MLLLQSIENFNFYSKRKRRNSSLEFLLNFLYYKSAYCNNWYCMEELHQFKKYRRCNRKYISFIQNIWLKFRIVFNFLLNIFIKLLESRNYNSIKYRIYGKIKLIYLLQKIKIAFCRLSIGSISNLDEELLQVIFFFIH